MTAAAFAADPARLVDLEQVFNLRDLGGLSAADGRRVRSGLVYRADQFGNATVADLERIRTELGVRTVVDLRRPDEIEEAGSFPAADGVQVKSLELKHLRWDDFDQSHVDSIGVPEFVRQRYIAMAETGAESVRGALDLICDAGPLVFHCMAGKDRTGIVAAVTLKLLGVDDAQVTADFDLTSTGLRRYWSWRNPEVEPAAWGIGAVSSAMSGLLRHFEFAYGGVENYAVQIGFSRAAELRAKLLA